MRPDLVVYNIAPTQQVPIIRLNADGERELAQVRWGLVPFWAKDPKIGKNLIDARAETVAPAPAFRSAFKTTRCLIPASGFYEWQKRDDYLYSICVDRKDWEKINFGAFSPIDPFSS